MNYTYCPQCKHPLETRKNSFYCPSCDLEIYQNSKPCVSVLIVKDGKVLLAKRGIEPYKGSYDTVGGFLKYGEPAEVGALRETKEETGLDVRLIEILGTYINQYGENGVYTLDVDFIAEITGGEMQAQDDVAELEWVDIHDIPFEEIRFASAKKGLEDLQKWYEAKNS
ncbi:MAG: NUDIX hydrolase [bacterium]